LKCCSNNAVTEKERKMSFTFPQHDPYFYSGAKGTKAHSDDSESIVNHPESFLPIWAAEVLIDAQSNQWMTDEMISFNENAEWVFVGKRKTRVTNPELTIYNCLTIKKGKASGFVVANFSDNPPMHIMSEVAADMIRGLGAHYKHYTD
jgi:hypothetical protein